MNLPRRFLNLVMDDVRGVGKSLHRINLARQSFFNTAPMANGAINDGPGSAAAADAFAIQRAPPPPKTRVLRLPAPCASFAPTPSPCNLELHCLPLTESKIVCIDQSARAVLYDIDKHHVETMPGLNMPKDRPISFSIPSTEEDGQSQGLYIMEKMVLPSQLHQFEAFIRDTSMCGRTLFWSCHPLPSPPYAREGRPERSEVKSYTVVGGGGGGGYHICISLEGFGTYCFDTVSRTWSHAGDWMLPFYGKAEYVPELNLWFGLSAEDHLLCATDLSNITMDSRPPQLVNVWKELEPPEEWVKVRDPELIYLGSGRFCIARFYIRETGQISDDETSSGSYSGDELSLTLYEGFSLMTGVEVVPCCPEDKHNVICNKSSEGNGFAIGNGNGNSSGNGNGIVNGNNSGNDNGIFSGNDDGNNSGTCKAIVSGNDNDSNGGTGNGNVNNSRNGNGKGLQMIKHKSRRYKDTGSSIVESIF